MRKEIKEFNKMDLLIDICEYHAYRVVFHNGEVICSCDYDDDKFTSPSIVDALIEWKSSLEEEDKLSLGRGGDSVWLDEVNFITSLEFDRLTDFQLGRKMGELLYNSSNDYKEVCFADIDVEHYKEIGKNLRENLECYNDFKNAHSLNDESNIFWNLSQNTYDFIKLQVDNNLLTDYYFDTDEEVFTLREVTKEKLLETYGEYGIPFKQIRKLDCYSMSYDLEFSKMKEYVFSFDEDGENGSTEVLAVLELGNFDIEFCEYGYTEKGNLDTGFFCCAKYKETGWQSEGFADLKVYEEMFDSKDKFEEEMYKAMIEYMKKEGFKWSEENSDDIEDDDIEDKECFNNVSSLDVRFTVGATYKGLVNVGLHDIDFTIGVPFVNNYGQLKMATRVLVSLDLDNAKVNIKNLISSDNISNSVRYWIGVSTEEISELLYNTVQKNNLTSNYIEIQNKEGRTKRMQVKIIEDLIKLDKVDGMIVGANIEDKSLENQIKKYINQDLSSLTEDCLDFLNGKLKGSLDLFEKLLNRESLSYWMNEAEVYTYETDNVCYAIEYFLEDNANIPYEALEYMDCKGYFDNVVRCETLKSEDGYIAILDR